MATKKSKSLEQQVTENSKKVHTESYSMSIGEIKNLYDEGELDLHPEFQRFFRWNDEQKFKLIESILLGIPLPSFFVHQKEDGIWDVVDGLQRLSTIFEFMGALKKEDNTKLPPLEMKGTRYLPGLEGMRWENTAAKKFEIPETIKRDFKRKKLDFNIILKHSDETTKYELFERLNTGGEKATSQEIRNSILVRENEAVYRLISDAAQNEDFINTTQLSDNNLDERFDLELLTRFLVLKSVDLSTFSKISANDYLNEEIIKRAVEKEYDWQKDIESFKKTFEILNDTLGENAFKNFNVKKNKFQGGFVVSAFEVIALGIGYNLSNKNLTNERIIELTKKFWAEKNSGKIKWSGRNTTHRLLITLAYGRKLYKA
jgi:uncharacterized protein with ParB-like and HNH nuclease domain